MVHQLDIYGILPFTKRVLVLGEGQLVAVTKLGPTVTDLSGAAVERRIVRVTWDVAQAQKGGYPHYMLKEINEDAGGRSQRDPRSPSRRWRGGLS